MFVAVVFDVYGTLTGFEKLREQQSVRIANILGVPPETLRTALLATYDERARGVFGDVRQQIVVLAERLGVHPSQSVIDEVVRRRMEGQWAILQPRPGAVEVLRALRDLGVKIGVLTDCTAETPELWPTTVFAGVVDCAVFSCELGFRKPNKKMYDTVLAGLGVRAEDAAYVGDGGSSELTGAASAGLFPILLTVEGEDHFRYDEEADWSGASVADLSEILNVVEQANHT